MRYVPCLTGLDHPTAHSMTSKLQLHPTSQTCSAVTLVFGTKIINHVPHQWCSGLRVMLPAWISMKVAEERFLSTAAETRFAIWLNPDDLESKNVYPYIADPLSQNSTLVWRVLFLRKFVIINAPWVLARHTSWQDLSKEIRG